MLTKLFWALLVISFVFSFLYRVKLQAIYTDKVKNRDGKSEIENTKIIKDYDISNLTLASGTSITLKDREYIYNFIKRLESHNGGGGEKVKEQTYKKVQSVYFDMYKDAYLHMEKGEIRINIDNDLDTVWNDYLSALGDNKLSYKLKNERNSLVYLDLRFPNKLFYKFNTVNNNTKSSSTKININQNDQRVLATSTISSSTRE